MKELVRAGDARGRGRLLDLAARHPRRRTTAARCRRTSRRPRRSSRCARCSRSSRTARSRSSRARYAQGHDERRPRAALRDRARRASRSRSDRSARRPTSLMAWQRTLGVHAQRRARRACGSTRSSPRSELGAAPAARRHVHSSTSCRRGVAALTGPDRGALPQLRRPRGARPAAPRARRACSARAPFSDRDPRGRARARREEPGRGRPLASRELAAERGGDALDAFLDLSIAEDLDDRLAHALDAGRAGVHRERRARVGARAAS